MKHYLLCFSFSCFALWSGYLSKVTDLGLNDRGSISSRPTAILHLIHCQIFTGAFSPVVITTGSWSPKPNSSVVRRLILCGAISRLSHMPSYRGAQAEQHNLMENIIFWDMTPCSPLSFPEDDTLHNHRCENLKSYNITLVFICYFLSQFIEWRYVSLRIYG
jgi:hypothetical protein